MLKKLWYVLVVEVLLVVLLMAGLMLSEDLLFVETSAERADAIIVLGGESGGRPFRAAELFAQGLAPAVIVSGKGDCRHTESRLRLAGVPEKAIRIECQSGTTRENALFSVRILQQELNAESAIIVTSWWHSRRALACFRAAAPDLNFYSMPDYGGPAMWRKPSTWEWVVVLQEYLKVAYYAVWHGIS